MKRAFVFVVLFLSLPLFYGCPDTTTTPVDPQNDGFSVGTFQTRSLNSTQSTVVLDSATGIRFMFPDGAHGDFRIAPVNIKNSSSAIGNELAMFKISFSGTEQLRIAIPRSMVQYPRFLGWMKPRDEAHHHDAYCWVAMPRLDSTASDWIYIVKASSASVQKNGNTIQADPAGSTPAVLGVGSTNYATEALMQMDIDNEIQAMRALMPSATQSVIDAAHKRIPASIEIIAASGESCYTPWWGLWTKCCSSNGCIEIRANASANIKTHETGHYMHHMLRGDNEYDAVVKASKQTGLTHGVGDLWDRQSVIEEYPYYFEYARHGQVVAYDVSYNPEDPQSSGFFSGNIFGKKDFPSLEGFGTAMLAQLHSSRGSVRTHYLDRNSVEHKEVDATPIIGASHNELCSSIVSTGFVSTNDLYSKIRSFCEGRGEAAKFPILMERIGWSYKLKGRLLWRSTETEPIVGVPVQAFAMVGSTRYTVPFDTSSTDGSFILPRCFPSSDVRLHIMLGDKTFLANLDTLVSISDFDPLKSTSTTLNVGDIYIDPPVVEPIMGQWSVYPIVCTASSCSSCGATSFSAPISLGGKFYLTVDGQGMAQSSGSNSYVYNYESASISGTIKVNPKYRLSSDQRYLINLQYQYKRVYSNADLVIQGSITNSATSSCNFNGSLNFIVYEDEKKAKVSCSCTESPSTTATVAKGL